MKEIGENGDENHQSTPVECFPLKIDMPVKATMISCLLGLTTLVMFVPIYNFLNVSLLHKMYILACMNQMVNTVQSPMIVFFTMRQNRMNRAISQAKERQEKQQAEIKYALEKRQERMMKEQD